MRLAPKEVEIVTRILKEHVPEHEVWMFGSRVHGRRLKPFSDIDLAVISDAPLSLDVLARLKHAFSESDLPFRVDVVDWATTADNFRAIIEKEHEIIQPR